MGALEKSEWLTHLFQEYYDILIIRGARHVAHDPILHDAVEDCVSDTFLLAWDKCSELEDCAYILGWLTKVLYNKLDNVRTSARVRIGQNALPLDGEKAKEIEDTQAFHDLENWIESENNQEVIHRLLSLLSKSETEIFEAYFLEGKHAREIQYAKGMSMEGVRAAIRRIRKKAKRAAKKLMLIIVPLLGTLFIFSQIIK